MSITGALPPTICHPFHQKTVLTLVTTRPSGFRCDGCKQFGQGSVSYRCAPCDFDLHTHCATAPAVLDHVLFGCCSRFLLYANHTTQNGYMYCSACGGETVGFRYYNQSRNLYLHPCCAFLPMRVLQDGRAFDLRYDASPKCGICRKMSQSLSYFSYYDNGEPVYLHVSCLANTQYLLTGYKNWQASAPIVQGVLGTYAKQEFVSNGDAKEDDTTKAILGAAKLVINVLTLDPVGIAESAHELMDAFS